MKKQVSGFDLYHILKELQELDGARIDKIYRDKRHLLLSVYTGSRRTNLAIDVPSVLYLTDNKPTFEAPDGFCMFLRRRLQRGKILRIEQLGMDRIVRFEISTKDAMYHLYLEFFSKGNVIVCDEKDKIISVLEPIVYQERAVRGGVVYAPPKPQPVLHALSYEDFVACFGEKPISVILATRLGFGGEYATLICEHLGIAADQIETSMDTLYAFLQELFLSTDVVRNEKGVYPLSFVSGDKITSMSEGIAALHEPQREEKKKQQTQKHESKQLTKVQKMHAEQEKQIELMTVAAEENKRKGELIYEHYQELEVLLKMLTKDRRNLNKKELKAKYADHPLVAAVTSTSVTIAFPEQQ